MKPAKNNCEVLSETSANHVTTATPWGTKKKQQVSAEELGINGVREANTTKLRKPKGQSVKAI